MHSIFKIPINQYKNDMDTESSKGKKDEILNLFTNHNHIKSETEFDEIKSQLHQACEEGDLEFIKILLSETIVIDSKEMVFKIDKTNKTASLFKVNPTSRDVIIPRTINYEMTDYLITSITKLGCHFNWQRQIESIKFEEGSSVRTIYGQAFKESVFFKIYFPKSLIELKNGWCDSTNFLIDIIISPSNDKFIFKDNKYLLGKSDQSKNEFDTLLFVPRNIKEISIPNNVTIIGPFSFTKSQIEEIFIPPSVAKISENAFSHCGMLTKVDIPTNSNLQTIEKSAFSSSDVKEISIPPSVAKICEDAFHLCASLAKVEIPTNSNLQTIGKNAFSFSKIEELFIPSSLVNLEDGWFMSASKLSNIIVSPSNGLFIFKDGKYLLGKSDPNSDEFNTLLYVRNDIKETSIPTDIKIIGSYSFFSSNIEIIFVPPSVTKICNYSFANCDNLRKFEISANSNLQTIEQNAFFNSNIKNISIPASVTQMGEFAFSFCFELKIVEISEESKLKSIPISAFYESSMTIVMIPPSLKNLIHANSTSIK